MKKREIFHCRQHCSCFWKDVPPRGVSPFFYCPKSAAGTEPWSHVESSQERSQRWTPLVLWPHQQLPERPCLFKSSFFRHPGCTQRGEKSLGPGCSFALRHWSRSWLFLAHVRREPRGTNNSICCWIAKDFNESTIYLASPDSASPVTRRGTE